MKVDKIPVNCYGVDRAIAEAFAESLRAHIAYVQEAGRMIGVPEGQLVIHDDSKWSEAEFPGYALYFFGNKDNQAPADNPSTSDEFARAWLHHIHHNPHHWQHWIFSDGFTPKGSRVEDGLVEMPRNYAIEMIADWMGAGRAYTGSWDMADWLDKHIPKIRVHSKTAALLREFLDSLGYADLVNIREFAK